MSVEKELDIVHLRSAVEKYAEGCTRPNEKAEAERLRKQIKRIEERDLK